MSVLFGCIEQRGTKAVKQLTTLLGVSLKNFESVFYFVNFDLIDPIKISCQQTDKNVIRGGNADFVPVGKKISVLSVILFSLVCVVSFIPVLCCKTDARM